MGRSPGPQAPLVLDPFLKKTLSILIRVYKMENNYETLRMPELKALARERRLIGYSWLRKADLIAFLQNNEQRRQRPLSPPPQRCTEPAPWMSPSGAPLRGATWDPSMSTWELEQPELEVPLTKRQLKHR